MNSRITCYGGAGEVTGANFLLDTGGARILIDCGMKQREYSSHGGCDESNLQPFAYDCASVNALIVTHAHADHIGRIPKLVRDGFRGDIYSTKATKELSAVMFDDALSIMRSDLERRGCPPMFEESDIRRTLASWQTREYHESFRISDVAVELLDAGHVLGSAIVRLSRQDRSIAFTGDLGNSPEPLLNDTEIPQGVHYLLMESVYGDRLHEGRRDRIQKLRDTIEKAQQQKGTLLIPSFSIERTQVLLYEINKMIEGGAIAPLPVYLDSPLAARITDIYRAHVSDMNQRARESFGASDPFSFKALKVTANSKESHALHHAPEPKIIIAGSGMSEGGRVRDHEKYYLGRKNAIVLFVGYQAAGSLGRRIQSGEKKVRIDGETVEVKASVASISGFSGHKDRDGLLSFVEGIGDSLEKVFVTMGEPKSSLFLAQRVRDFLGVDSYVPSQGESMDIFL